MNDEILYSLVFLLMGLIAILWYRESEADNKDPYLIKPTFLWGGIFCFMLSLYLLIKGL